MSIWIDPKTDWHPSNEEAVSGDDFNRIEKNAEYLYDRQERHIDICGNVSAILAEGYGSVAEGWGRNLQRINVNIPANMKLECVHVRIGGLRPGFAIICCCSIIVSQSVLISFRMLMCISSSHVE